MNNQYFLDMQQKVHNAKEVPAGWGNRSFGIEMIEDFINKEMESFAAPTDDDDLGFWYFNAHDQQHIKRVIGFIFQLIERKKIEIQDYQLYLLYIAAYGHDLGMAFWSSDLRESYEKILGYRLDTGKRRGLHNRAGAYKLEDILVPYITNPTVRATIEQIVDSHSGDLGNVIDTAEIDREPINLSLLIALLRIADIMDAGVERLPSVDIVAKCLALASTCPKPFLNQCEHYLRRHITLECEVQSGGMIVLKIRNDFDKLSIETPCFGKGEKQSVQGTDAFLGVIGEFVQHLGEPINYQDVKAEYNDLNWASITKFAKNPISKSLLGKSGIEIPWRIEKTGPRMPVIPPQWTNEGEKCRKRFDNQPPPIEIQIEKSVKREANPENKKSAEKKQVVESELPLPNNEKKEEKAGDPTSNWLKRSMPFIIAVLALIAVIMYWLNGQHKIQPQPESSARGNLPSEYGQYRIIVDAPSENDIFLPQQIRGRVVGCGNNCSIRAYIGETYIGFIRPHNGEFMIDLTLEKIRQQVKNPPPWPWQIDFNLYNSDTDTEILCTKQIRVLGRSSVGTWR
jgi:hypothetical protein